MKTRRKPSTKRRKLTLGDLVLAVAASGGNREEMAAAIDDLFRRGRVVLEGGQRARVVA